MNGARALVTGRCQICSYDNDLDDLTVVHSSRERLIRLLQAAGAASIIIALLYVAMPGLAIGTIVSSLILLLTHVRHRSTALDLSIVSDSGRHQAATRTWRVTLTSRGTAVQVSDDGPRGRATPRMAAHVRLRAGQSAGWMLAIAAEFGRLSCLAAVVAAIFAVWTVWLHHALAGRMRTLCRCRH